MKATAPQTWTILEVLRWTTDDFRGRGVAEPRAAAEVLLAHALSLSRLDLYLRYDQPLAAEELTGFKALVVRRRQGEPVAYLTGHKEFWSLDFRVTPAVLIPRPETEVLVSAVVAAVKKEGGAGNQGPRALVSAGESAPPPYGWGLEVGVGSGAVVVALAKELPWMIWTALDLSLAALRLARDNARQHQVAPRLYFLQSDLLASLKPKARFDLMVANLPYVPRTEWEQLPKDIKDFEPKEALLGGEDGLALLRPLCLEAHHYLSCGGWLALEVGPGQAHQVREFLQDTGAYDRLDFFPDYHGLNRVVRARRRAGG